MPPTVHGIRLSAPELLALQLRNVLVEVQEVRSCLYPMTLDHVHGASTAWWKLSPVEDGLLKAIAALEVQP
jgi:hypothetical protein